MTMTRDELLRLVEASVETMTTRLTAQITDLTNQLQCLKPPSVEAYEPVALGNFRGTSLDLVKSVPEFKGEIKAYPAWREAAHFAMNYYPPNTENNYIAVGILRNKITGTANDKLASFNTVLNFKAIIARLDQCFGDKRSLQALENELSILRQGEKSISDFYNLVDQHLTLIINKNKMSYPSNDDIANALNERARDNALRVFISGLKRPLSDILFSARSTDLPTALATAQELESDQRRQEFARIFAMGDNARVPRSQQSTTTPPQISHPAYKTKNANKQNFSKNDNRMQTSQAVPMDVDPSSSMFRRPTAYANQQQQTGNQGTQRQHFKRKLQKSGSGRSAPAQKVPRVNHIAEDIQEAGDDYYDYKEDVGSIITSTHYDEEDVEVEELNFLD